MSSSTNTIPSFHSILSNFQRCFVEDFMCLIANEPCIILVPLSSVGHCNHYMYLINYAKKTTKIKLGNNEFYVCHSSVYSNSDFGRIESGLISNLDVKDAIFSNKNSGVYMIPLVINDNNNVNETLVTWQHVLNGRRTGVQVWKHKGVFRDTFSLFENNKNNDDRLISILFNTVEEIYFDAVQMQHAEISFYRAKVKSKDKRIVDLNRLVLELKADVVPDSSVLDAFVNRIDSVYEKALVSCFHEFTSISEPIVDDTMVLMLIDEYKTKLPGHYNRMMEFLNFKTKSNELRNNHLTSDMVAYYDRIALTQFMVVTRIQNPQKLVHWASICQASNYCHDIISNNTGNLGSFFGYSVSYATFYRLINVWKGDINVNINNRCRTEDRLVAYMDNNQRSYARRFQREGVTTHCFTCTATLIKECLVEDLVVETILDSCMDDKSSITFVEQAVPSPLKMKQFEMISLFEDKYACLSELGLESFNGQHKIDTCGTRVLAYYNLANTCQILHMMKTQSSRYVFGSNEVKYCKHTPVRFQSDKMSLVMKKIFTMYRSDCFKGNCLKSFLYKSMTDWNKHSKTVAKILVPPVTDDDEVSNKGYGMALIKLLTLVGLLNYAVQPTETTDPSWILCDDIDEKLLYLCLDGMSINRHRSFKKSLSLLPMNFMKSYEQSIIFKKAIDQVIPIPGPLHMSFHMLQSIYIVFDKLLHVAQKCLHWKCIYPTKISNCFRLSNFMAVMLFEEVNRYFFLMFINDMEMKKDILLDDLVNSNIEKGPHLVAIAESFQLWMDGLIDNANVESRNDNITYLANYWNIMSVFIIYINAQRCGESVLMEQIENKFCAIFTLLEKNHYVDLCLDQIEYKYKQASHKSLHEIRMNICCRYHSRDDDAFHVLDETMENVNKWMKGLPLRPNIESWTYHTPNIVLAKRCNNFVKMQMKRSKVDTELSDLEHGYCNNTNSGLSVKKTTVPSYQKEKSRLYELLVMGLESGSNVFKKNVWMENIELLSTDLKGSNEETALNDNTDELDNMIDCILNDTNNDNGDGNEESIIEAVVEIAVEDTNNDSTSDCNKYGLCNIWKEGKLKMIKCDYVNRRKLEKIRTVRMNIFIEGIYNGVKDRETNNNNTNTSISRLRNLLNGNVQLQKTQGMHHYDRI